MKPTITVGAIFACLSSEQKAALFLSLSAGLATVGILFLIKDRH
jgi:hypothetical protein